MLRRAALIFPQNKIFLLENVAFVDEICTSVVFVIIFARAIMTSLKFLYSLQTCPLRLWDVFYFLIFIITTKE